MNQDIHQDVVWDFHVYRVLRGWELLCPLGIGMCNYPCYKMLWQKGGGIVMIRIGSNDVHRHSRV